MKTQREQEGWLGPVRTVIVEMADFLEQGGTQTLDPRVPLFTLRYDIQGKRVGEKTYYSLHGESGVNDCVTSHDTEGNTSALFCFSNGGFLYKVIPTYDSNKRVVEELFCDAMGNPYYRREHEYDAHGKPIEYTHSEVNGTVVNKLKYENEYDSIGNLTEVTIFKWSTSNGKSFYKPIMINYQTITYY